ncbi:type II toxin-antitoxin system VapC family toxin [Polaromonas sp. P1(28)-13]|nr:type II toxin-antitoxin system VapC family toxin [Polaromonas sp. P1(28)-13]
MQGEKTASADYAKAFAAYLRHEKVALHVPIHFDLEVTGPLLKVFRAKSPVITEKALNAALAEMDALPLNFHAMGMGFRQTADLARAYNLSIYDTPYFNQAQVFGRLLILGRQGLGRVRQARRKVPQVLRVRHEQVHILTVPVIDAQHECSSPPKLHVGLRTTVAR